MYELIPLEYMTLEIERERSNRGVPQLRMTRESIVPVARHTNLRTLEIAIVIMVALSLATLISAVA
jgi:2-hydroxychromene-2-carboxylate isomerase